MLYILTFTEQNIQHPDKSNKNYSAPKELK